VGTGRFRLVQRRPGHRSHLQPACQCTGGSPLEVDYHLALEINFLFRNVRDDVIKATGGQRIATTPPRCSASSSNFRAVHGARMPKHELRPCRRPEDQRLRSHCLSPQPQNQRRYQRQNASSSKGARFVNEHEVGCEQDRPLCFSRLLLSAFFGQPFAPRCGRGRSSLPAPSCGKYERAADRLNAGFCLVQ
jgi:hypothetical protein